MEVQIFPETTLNEYCKVHLMGLPDMFWDYCGWWTPTETHGFSVFKELVIEGKHMENFGSFCEQWFLNENLALSTTRNPCVDDD